MSKNFSFTSFLNNNSGSNKDSNNSARTNNPTPKQISYYNDLCGRKNVTPKNMASFTFETLGAEIEKLRAMPDPASPRQIEKILELQGQIIEAGADFKPYTQEFLDSLTGGRDGSASALIQTLFDKRKEVAENAPVSDAQLEVIVQWYLCPDIEFENISVERIYPKKPGANESESLTENVCINRIIPLSEDTWRKMTPQEFADEIAKKLTRKQASKFIDENRAKFYEWRKTRITAQQINYIRELEKRLANIHTPKQVEFAVDENGETYQVTPSNHRESVSPVAYTSIEEIELAQMSYEDASTFIDQLKSELENRDMTKFGNIYNDDQDQLEANRTAKNETEAYSEEFNKLNDLIFSIEAILGYSVQEAHDAVQEVIMEEHSDETVQNKKDLLHEFFMSTVTVDQEKNEQAWNSQMARIFNMCEDAGETALSILTKQY